MKAIQISAHGQTRILDLPKPRLEAGHVLLRIAYVGFCGSDLNTFRGVNPLAKMPVVPGHEVGAIIEAVGEGVPTHLKSGMRVTGNRYTACDLCPACLNGKPNACEFNQTLGVQRDGAMAEYFSIPWEKIIADDFLEVRELALVEPLSVGFHAASRGRVSDTDNVLVIGCGMIGAGAIVRSSLRGADVIAADVDDDKLAMAKRLGAKHTVNTHKENLDQVVYEMTGGRGADVVIEAVGRPETYLACISAAAFTARVVFIGYAKEKVPFDTHFFVKKELDILGSRNAMPDDFKAVIKYLKQGVCPVDKLISVVCRPEEAQRALEKWDGQPGSVFRVLIEF